MRSLHRVGSLRRRGEHSLRAVELWSAAQSATVACDDHVSLAPSTRPHVLRLKAAHTTVASARLLILISQRKLQILFDCSFCFPR